MYSDDKLEENWSNLVKKLDEGMDLDVHELFYTLAEKGLFGRFAQEYTSALNSLPNKDLSNMEGSLRHAGHQELADVLKDNMEFFNKDVVAPPVAQEKDRYDSTENQMGLPL